MGPGQAASMADTDEPIAHEDSALTRARHWLWRPYLTIFVSSFCIMVLELAAERVIAPYVGSSLYTWTTVIGVVLTGIAVGNAIGGRLADRHPSVRLLGVIFAAAGLAALLVLLIDSWLSPDASGLPLLCRVVLVMASMFLLPSTILGCVSPMVARLAMPDLARAGRTVGTLYAVATLGSIVGTVGTGFWLIPSLRVDLIIVAVGTLLLLWGLGLLLVGRLIDGVASQ